MPDRRGSRSSDAAARRGRRAIGIVAGARSLVAAAVTAGLVSCGTAQLPRPLTSEESQRVARARIDATVAVRPSAWSDELLEHLRSSGVFRDVVLLGPNTAGDLIAEAREPCSAHEGGGWVPLLPIVSLGLIPQWRRVEYGYSIAFASAHEPRAEVVLGCAADGRLVIGWLGLLLNALPGYTTADVEKSVAFDRRVAFALAEAAPLLEKLLADTQ